MAEDPTYWIEQCKAIVSVLHAPLTEEDEQRLEQIKTWCEESPTLWKVVARIGWEINEG